VKKRHAWIQLIKGNIEIDGVVLDERDGASVSDQQMLNFLANQKTEFIAMDLK
jgi:redox-sensitive bicupin YhaK (pirin superfamily)